MCATNTLRRICRAPEIIASRFCHPLPSANVRRKVVKGAPCHRGASPNQKKGAIDSIPLSAGRQSWANNADGLATERLIGKQKAWGLTCKRLERSSC